MKATGACLAAANALVAAIGVFLVFLAVYATTGAVAQTDPAYTGEWATLAAGCALLLTAALGTLAATRNSQASLTAFLLMLAAALGLCAGFTAVLLDDNLNARAVAVAAVSAPQQPLLLNLGLIDDLRGTEWVKDSYLSFRMLLAYCVPDSALLNPIAGATPAAAIVSCRGAKASLLVEGGVGEWAERECIAAHDWSNASNVAALGSCAAALDAATVHRVAADPLASHLFCACSTAVDASWASWGWTASGVAIGVTSYVLLMCCCGCALRKAMSKASKRKKSAEEEAAAVQEEVPLTAAPPPQPGMGGGLEGANLEKSPGSHFGGSEWA